ncbi:MAG: hypothetical protein GX663_02870 [Clostridiales bacterium]|nr:hypothetical protein [Clostridiales bacterium]
MSLKILHLSDLHIGENHKEAIPIKDLAYKIVSSLDGKIPEAIIVTGDIFDYTALESEKKDELIKEAINFFEKLIELINNGTITLTKDTTFFVPGNHEVAQKNAISNDGIRYQIYEEFLTLFYQDNIPKFYDNETWSVFSIFEEKGVMLLGFNSANIETNDKNEIKTFGAISEKQLYIQLQKAKAISNIEEYVCIAFLHHHFYLMDERNKDELDSATLHNSEGFLNILCKFNTIAILHGHKHSSSNRRMNIDTSIETEDMMTTVLGCGSTDKGDTLVNSFNFIEVYSLNNSYDLKYQEFEYKNSSFYAKQEIRIPVKSTNNAKINLDFVLKENPDFEQRYKQLRTIDTSTLIREFYDMINYTIFRLSSSAEEIKEDNKVVYYILAAIHYQADRENNFTFYGEIEQFFREILNIDFSEKMSEFIISKLQAVSSIYDIHDFYKVIMDDNLSLKQSRYIVYFVITLFLTKCYTILKYNPDNFVEDFISSKVPFSYNLDKLKKNIEGAMISFDINEEKRALELEVTCKTAEAHKVISLIIKEFELILAELEQDFARFGFRVYYILPMLPTFKKGRQDCLESHIFSAYIPKLIPLLAGRQIYSEQEAFTRELLQNSIDAINLRVKMDSNFAKNQGKIELFIGTYKNQNYFQIIDNGIGMDRYVMERYLTTIGRSFYKSSDFNRLDAEYDPISQFGIGFLSCFMMGKRVVVESRYYSEGVINGHSLDIPNFDGCFFIENKEKLEVGTKVTVYENEERKPLDKNFGFQPLKTYIEKTIIDVPFDIWLNNQLFVEKQKYKKMIESNCKDKKLCFFIPIKDSEYIFDGKTLPKDYFYGIYFYKEDGGLLNEKNHTKVLCAGIRVRESNNFHMFKALQYPKYFNVYANFPSSTVSLNVSRETISDINIPSHQIETELKEQIYSYVDSPYGKQLTFGVYSHIGLEDYSATNIHFMMDGSNVLLKYDELDINDTKRVTIETINFLFKKILKVEHKIKYDIDLEINGYTNSTFYILIDTIKSILTEFELKNIDNKPKTVHEVKPSCVTDEHLNKIKDNARHKHAKINDYKKELEKKNASFKKVITMILDRATGYADYIANKKQKTGALRECAMMIYDIFEEIKTLSSDDWNKNTSEIQTYEKLIKRLNDAQTLQNLEGNLKGNFDHIKIDLAFANKLFESNEKAAKMIHGTIIPFYMVTLIWWSIQLKPSVNYFDLLEIFWHTLYSSKLLTAHIFSLEDLQKGIALDFGSILDFIEK